MDWIEQNKNGEHAKLNEIFKKTRQSTIYSFKRQCMRLQYEILQLGLKGPMQEIAMEARENKGPSASDNEGQRMSIFDDVSKNKKYKEKEKKQGLYYHFASYFVDDKQNLIDIMQ